jgi:hypothetical protein
MIDLYLNHGFLFFDDDATIGVASAGSVIIPPDVPVPANFAAHYVAWITHPDNYVPAVTLTASAELAGYPASNTQILPVTKTWRASSGSIQTIELDLGGALPVNIAALVNHNHNSDVSISIAAGNTLSYGSFSTTMTWREFTAFKYMSTNPSYRYWKFTLNDGNNPAGYMSIGYIMLGVLTRPDFNFRNGWLSTAQFINQDYASPLATQFIAGMYRKQKLSLEFGPLLDAEMTVLRDLYSDVRRSVDPLLILPARDGSDAYFGRLQGMFEENVNIQRYTSVLFEEDGYGRRQ